MTSAIPVQALSPTELSNQLGAGHLRVRIYPVDGEQMNINIRNSYIRTADKDRIVRRSSQFMLAIKEARNSFFGLGVYLLKSKFRIEDKLRFP